MKEARTPVTPRRSSKRRLRRWKLRAHCWPPCARSRARGRLDNTLLPFHEIQRVLAQPAHRAGLYSEVHPERPVREAAEKATQLLSAFATDLSLDPGLFRALSEVDASVLPKDAQRYLAHALRDFRRAGVDKDEATRKRLKALAEEAVLLGQTFDRAIREDVRSVKLRPEQLAGLPEDYRAAHPPGPDGLVTVTTDYPDLLPFRQYAHDGEARRALYIENGARAWPANEDTLRSLLKVRFEQAKLLGYTSWADYVTEDKMARSAETVRSLPGQRGPGLRAAGAGGPRPAARSKAQGRPFGRARRRLGKGLLRGAGEAGGLRLRQPVRPALLRIRPHPRRPARHLQSPLRRQLPESRRRRRLARKRRRLRRHPGARGPGPHLPGPPPAAGQVQARGAIPAGARASRPPAPGGRPRL